MKVNEYKIFSKNKKKENEIKIESKYVKRMWLDRGIFWEHTAPQGSDEWKQARVGRINSSNSGAMAEKSNFKNAEETGKIIAGVKEEEFTLDALERMNHGHIYESVARDWYIKNTKCKVLERGLCVNKSDYTIGASVDGDVLKTKGIIEIKCPVKMYNPILSYMENVDHGWKPEKDYHGHIWESHYTQMQHGLFVLNKSWCDYIVYCTESGQIFTQRIKFNEEYWKEHYSVIKNNYNKYVKPFLKDGYPLIPK